MSGKFIVIEGLEGAGKSTAVQCVVDVLNKHHITQIELTREPGGTPLAEQLRTLIKANNIDETISPITELLLLYAARVQLVENKIKPALNCGRWVVGDRHDLSTQAYQGGGRKIDTMLLSTLKKVTLGNFTPDFTLYLDIDPEIGLKRAAQRGALDRFEQEALPFFQRIRQCYLELANKDKTIVIINAEQSLDNVKKTIENQLTFWLDSLKEAR